MIISLKKTIRLLTFSLLCVICATMMCAIPSYASCDRDDGVWLFPLAKNSGYSFSDWAGCTQADKCTICGKKVDSKHQSWGDKTHGKKTYGHNGVDIAANKGTKVMASAPGTLYFGDFNGGYGSDSRGIFVVIEHSLDDKYSYYTYYQHLDTINTKIKSGSSVKAGDVIGTVGGSGGKRDTYKPHLHFAMIIAPKNYFSDCKKMSGKISTYESKGWLLNSENGKGGRIVTNPKSLTVDNNVKLKVSCTKDAIVTHAGSINYTFDSSKVTIKDVSKDTTTTKQSTTNSKKPTITIEGKKVPTTINEGSNFGLRGIIKTDYGVIAGVTGCITDSKGKALDGFSFEYLNNSSSFDLKSTLNNDLIFRNLKGGNYYYKVTAIAKNGTQLQAATVINAPFKVEGNSSSKANNASKNSNSDSKLSSAIAGSVASAAVATQTKEKQSDSSKIQNVNDTYASSGVGAIVEEGIQQLTDGVDSEIQNETSSESSGVAVGGVAGAAVEAIVQDSDSASSIVADVAESAVEKAGSVVKEQKPRITFNELNHPDIVHKQGSNFGIRGIISVDCGVITSVQGMVYPVKNTKTTLQSKEYKPNATTFDLKKSINNDLVFNNLPAGKYRYYVFVFAKNGSAESSRTYDYTFTVK